MGTIARCPLCEWTLDRPADLGSRNAAAVPSLAAALGMPADALLAIHQHHAAGRAEADIEAHMSTHKPQEWLPALMDARRDLTRYDDLVAELRRHIEALTRRLEREQATQ